MYNEDIKMSFIESLPESEKNNTMKTTLINFFNRLEKKVENEFREDFCQYDTDWAKLGVSLLGGRSYNTKSWYISRLKKYNDWAIKNKLSTRTQNSLQGISPSDIDNSTVYKYEMISDPNDLSEILSNVYTDPENQCMDTMYQTHIWLVFNGLTETESLSTTFDDVDSVTDIIYVNGKIIQLYPATKRCIEACLQMSYVNVERDGNIYRKKLTDTNFIIRTPRDINNTLESKCKNFRSAISVLNSRNKITGNYSRLSVQRLYDSGKFYRIYLRELEGEIISAKDFIDEFNINLSIKSALRKRSKLLFNNYNMWKKSFDLYK